MLHPQLEIFLQVVEAGSFTRAASLRNCSTVSIMNQMNSFEERMGLKLLERSSQGISLTKEGKIFYTEAINLENSARNILRNIKEQSAGQAAVINLGNSFLRPCRPLLDILQKCREAWRNSFQIRIENFRDEVEEFARFQDRLGEDVDCFISPYDSTKWKNKYSIFHLGYYKCCVSIPQGHRLADRKELAWKDLAGETLMLLSRGISPVIDRIRYDIEKHHPDIKLMDSHKLYDVDTFNMCQQKGYLIETPEIWTNIHPGIVTIPLDWPYRIPWGIIYSKKASPVFKSFINMLRRATES